MTDKHQQNYTINTLRKELMPYARPDWKKASGQLINTLLPYAALWALLIYMVNNGYSLLIISPFIVLASLFLLRIFIFFHDCAHGCFFNSQRANTIVGYITGILTFTPFAYWQKNHLIHHGTYADLDRRGIGDIWTMTVEEYCSSSKLKRIGYRLYRNPLIFLLIGPGYTFLLAQRFMHGWEDRNVRHSAAYTNLAIALILLVSYYTIGIKTYLKIQIPVMLIAGALGVWLFYVQHQFEGVYWARHADWDPLKAALEGSSFYKLPKLLQWFTGNIGLHHIHHVLPRIPNYYLQKCFDEVDFLQQVKPLTIKRSLKSLRLNLWDEKQQKLVGFRALKKN